MCPRRYRLGKREAEIQATRDAIVGAAKDLFQESGYHRTSIEDVARRADVAPATVYYQFGSKPGLLDAVLAAVLDGRDGEAGSIGTDTFDDLDQVVVVAVRRVCRGWVEEASLLRSLLALGSVDPALRPVIEKHDEARRAVLRRVAAQLAERKALAPGYDERRAADVLSMLTGFSNFDHLVTRGGFSEAEAVASIAGLARALIDPDHTLSGRNGVLSNPITATA
ncbi:MAG: TetR/AcrR family transcriptional regulator [Dehalococcoidia bacterium]